MEFWEHSQSERQLAYNCRTLLLYIPHQPQKFLVSIMKNTWTTKGLSLHALHFSAVKHVTQGSHQRQMNLQPKYRVLRKKSFGSVSYVGNFATYWSRCKNSSDFGVGFPHAHIILIVLFVNLLYEQMSVCFLFWLMWRLSVKCIKIII